MDKELSIHVARLLRRADEGGDRVTAALLEGQLEAVEEERWILGRLAA
jgi:DNA-binding ferritin-like protein